MSSQLIESLEARQLLSADMSAAMTPMSPFTPGVNFAAAESADASAAPPAVARKAGPAAQKAARKIRKSDRARTTALGTQDVQDIIAAAASQILPTQAIAVTDRSGDLLGLFLGSGLNPADVNTGFNTVTGGIVVRAVERARTAAAFQSSGEAFTTRTARFIILNNFPQPIRNTGGGPLYGVEFSVLAGSDIVPDAYATPLLSGDPGGVPLYIQGVPVGGIGVAGDMKDTLPLNSAAVQLFANDPYGQLANPNKRVFNGNEDPDFDEAVAVAGARGFSAPQQIRATRIFIGGLRLPFTSSGAADSKPSRTLPDLVSAGAGQLVAAPQYALDGTTAPTGVRAGEPERVNAIVGGLPGLIRIRNKTGHTDIQESDPFVESDDSDVNGIPLPDSQKLTLADVNTVVNNAVRQSTITRAGIRKPNGLRARVHVIVVDRDGSVLAAFREEDATNFSYDVAVQKARTAAYFSDDQHAVTATAIGFMSQKFFPTGINTGVTGPLFGLQDQLSLNISNLSAGGSLSQNLQAGPPVDPAQPGRFKQFPLPNGMIIFPGGAPLYKNGVLVGAVGISGDGVLQDDLITYGGTLGFRPKEGQTVRVDQMSGTAVASYILNKLRVLETAPGIILRDGDGLLPSERAARTIGANSDIQLPYLKFPRNPIV